MAYGVVQGKTWRSPNIRGLSDSHKLAWPYFLSNKHSNMLGYYELPIPYMADDLEWSLEKSENIIKKLEERGLIAYDHAAQIIFICKYMKHNSLSRGARETGAITRLDDLVYSPLLARLLSAINEWQPQLEELRASIEKRCPGLSLFGDSEESSRTPRGDIGLGLGLDTGLGKVKDVENAPLEKVLKRLNELREQNWEWARYMPITSKSKKNTEHITALLKDGATVEELIIVLEWKAAMDGGHEESRNYFNCTTPFRPKHWENNLALAADWDAKGRPAKLSSNGQKTQKDKFANEPEFDWESIGRET